MKRGSNYIGQKYGRLVILDYYAGTHTIQPKIRVQCECGTVKVTWLNAVTRGSSTSCGCYRNEQSSKAATKHGGRHTPEYAVWCTMKARCSNPNNEKYMSYGGRGIEVCKRWADNFQNFIDDMGKRPSKRHSIERKDNNGNYEPSNCEWALPAQQMKNQRRSKLYDLNGKMFNLKEIAEILSINHHSLSTRMHTFKEPIEVAVEHCLNYQRSKNERN